MVVRTKVESIDRDVQVLLSETMGPRARSATIAEFALDALADAEATNKEALGTIPLHTTFVDGHEGSDADVRRVRPDGTIIFEFNLLEGVFAWIGEQLVLHSPIKSGRYSKSHIFLADGVETEAGVSAPAASEYVFISTLPYARKIEGVNGKPPESSQAPDGVYEAVATLARQRFGNLAKITFGFRVPTGGAVAEWSAKSLQHRRGDKQKRAEWLQRQPAIIITPR